MGQVLSYLALCLVPAAAFVGGARAVQWWVNHNDGPRTGAPPEPTGRSLQQLVATLHRLETQYDAVERSHLPARAHRMRVIQLAYDDTLRECCNALGLEPPGHPHLSSLERMATEAELALHGLRW